VIRRSFRFGLWVGLLCGIAVAVVKVVQARRSTPVPSAEPWTPLAREQVFAATSPAAHAEPAEEPAAAVTAEPEPHPELVLAPAPDDVATEEVPPPPAPEDTPPAVYAAKRVAKKAAKATEAAAKAADVTEALDNVAATPAPAKKAAKKAKATARLWVEPVGDVCPDSHPVKAKMASKILHPPGSPSYDRTVPDRCYKSAEAAEADGFRSAKR
jgi:hypothetical protein